MKPILTALFFFGLYLGFIFLMTRGRHPHSKSNEVQDAEIDVQLENLRQRSIDKQMKRLRENGL